MFILSNQAIRGPHKLDKVLYPLSAMSVLNTGNTIVFSNFQDEEESMVFEYDTIDRCSDVWIDMITSLESGKQLFVMPNK